MLSVYLFVGEYTDSPVLGARHGIDFGSQGQQLRCENCSLIFPDENSKSKHDIEIHGVKAFCGTCRKGFRSVLGYRYHMKQHGISYGLTENCYKCTFCGNFYPTVSRLRQHMRSHSEDRPFTCKLCGRSYKHNNGLKIHTCHGPST